MMEMKSIYYRVKHFVSVLQVAKNGQLEAVSNGEATTCGGRCGAAQCALCRGEVDTDNKQNIVSVYR